MNTKTKKALGILAALSVATFAGVAAASKGKGAPAPARRPIGQGSSSPEYDAQSPGWPTITQENTATNAGAALEQLQQVLQGHAPEVVEAVATALKNNTTPIGVPAEVAQATEQAQAAAADHDVASAGQPTQGTKAPTTVEEMIPVVSDLGKIIEQATPAEQNAIKIITEAVAAGQPIPPEAAQAAGGILQAAADTAAAHGIQVPPTVLDAVNEAAAQNLPDPGQVNAPSTLLDDTADLLALMLADEAQGNWKRKIPELASWQSARGLKADQMFGPKSAQFMAAETGLLPIVRYWPSGSYKEGKWLKDYKAALLTEAASAEEPRASQLRAAALREQGQAFAPVSPIKILIALE